MRFLMSGFFHEPIVLASWIHMLKYFQKYFRFREDFHKNIFVFRVTILGRQKKWSLDNPILLGVLN